MGEILTVEYNQLVSVSVKSISNTMDVFGSTTLARKYVWPKTYLR